MEESPSTPSVAELAGRLKGHVPAAAAASSHDEVSRAEAPLLPQVPSGRRPPRSLRLQHPKQDDDEAQKHGVSSNPLRFRTKSSPVIEKLQANLALSPAALLPSPKSPDVKLQPAPLSPPTPCGPPRPGLQPSQPPAEEEDPSSFDGPPDGAPLQSINKTRARLSFKRRPPTRQHRRSAGEETEASGSSPSPKENGDEHGDLGGVKEDEDEDRDCEKAEDEERRTSEEAQREEASEEEERPTAEDVARSTQHGGDDEL